MRSKLYKSIPLVNCDINYKEVIHMANFSFKDFVRKAKSAPAANQKWALFSFGFLVVLIVAWIANFFL